MVKIVQKISEEGKVIKKRIELVERDISELEEDLKSIASKCPHEFRELTDKEKVDRWMSVDAHCLICDNGFGWRCIKSPDHVCHYYSNDGKVELIDGTKVDVPWSDYDAKYESEDGCIFCGMPDERK